MGAGTGTEMPVLSGPDLEDLPLTVATDWDQKVEEADRICCLIDRHLEYEARGRMLVAARHFGPEHLCDEQKVQMISDLCAVVR